MGLFATLAASAGQDSSADGGASDGGSGSKPPSSSGLPSLPTAVQLYTSRCVDFLSGTIDGRGDGESSGSGDGVSNGGRRKFEVLTYQAVEVLDSSSPAGEGSDEQQQQQQLVRLPGTLQRTKQARKHTRPNLGVWDCRLPAGGPSSASSSSLGTKDSHSEELVDKLLAGVIPTNGDGADEAAASSPSVLFAVDLSDPAAVYPAVDTMRSALLRRYEAAGPTPTPTPQSKSTTAAGATTTRLSKLRAAKFGSAPQSKDAATANGAGAGAGPDGKIALVLCCTIPPPPAKGAGAPAPSQMFQAKQAQNLVLYHLHRFASEVNCTLAFVRADGEAFDPAAGGDAAVEGSGEGAASAAGGGRGGSAIPSVTVSELAAVVRRVAAGMSPVVGDADAEGAAAPEEAEKARQDEGGEGGAAAAKAGPASGDGAAADGALDPAQPPVYPPGSHDDDLIGSVLLRNASCPGVWDAATDDLWKALAPPKSASDKKSEEEKDASKFKSSKGAAAAAAAAAGDEAWLSKLSESVASLASADDDAASVKSGKGKDGVAAKLGKKKKAAPAGAANADAKGDDPTSFFENLLKK